MYAYVLTDDIISDMILDSVMVSWDEPLITWVQEE